jgi:hypothetical protein
MSKEIEREADGHYSPFEQIKRTNDAGVEFWSSRDFAGVLGYENYRNFEGVVEKAKLSCFNSGNRIEDHFVDIDEMVLIGSGAERRIKTTLMSRYAFIWRSRMPIPKRKSLRMVKLILLSRHDAKNWLMRTLRKREGSCCVKRCDATMFS